MDAREQARFDALKGASGFGVNNAADFNPVPPAVSTKAQGLFASLGIVADGDEATPKNTVLGNLIRAIKNQQSGAGNFHGGTTAKSVQREGLMAVLRSINKSAGAIATAQKTPEIMDSFRIPHGTNDTETSARALAFADAAVPLEAEFIALEQPADFIAALRKRVVDFGNADDSQNTGLQDQAGATASIDALIDQGLGILTQLDAIMHNKYAATAAKLAAWLTASHIQRPSASKPAAPPAPAPQAPK
jgi:hypothetical protein